MLRRRLEYPALKRAVREQQSLFNANVVLIEDKASGTQLIQELIVEGCYGVTKYKPECDKIMRLHAQTGLIESGFVYIPETASWLAEYLHEMTVFPKGKHDDQVDSAAQFLDRVKKPMPGWGIYEYRGRPRREVRKGNRNPSEIRFRAVFRDGRRAAQCEDSRGICHGRPPVCCPLSKYSRALRYTSISSSIVS